MKTERELISVSPQWIELPDDIMANILGRLEAVEILESAEKVCTSWRRICRDPAMWRNLEIEIDIDLDTDAEKKSWRRLVDRSQGQLTDLSILNFCDNHMLNYIVNRSSGLKKLTLVGTRLLSGEDLVEAVKKLPHLEGLHLSWMRQINAQDIINIGISCPTLKSFTFNRYPFWSLFTIFSYSKVSIISNECALAIAGTMPNLCHLCLDSEPIDNKGLEAILDGCPKLESLNLHGCIDLDLRGALGKRCSEQIIQLVFPSSRNKYGSCSDINQSIEDEDDNVAPGLRFDSYIEDGDADVP